MPLPLLSKTSVRSEASYSYFVSLFEPRFALFFVFIIVTTCFHFHYFTLFSSFCSNCSSQSTNLITGDLLSISTLKLFIIVWWWFMGPTVPHQPFSTHLLLSHAHTASHHIGLLFMIPRLCKYHCSCWTPFYWPAWSIFPSLLRVLTSPFHQCLLCFPPLIWVNWPSCVFSWHNRWTFYAHFSIYSIVSLRLGTLFCLRATVSGTCSHSTVSCGHRWGSAHNFLGHTINMRHQSGETNKLHILMHSLHLQLFFWFGKIKFGDYWPARKIFFYTR